MEPKTSDLVGAIALALVLAGAVLLLVLGALPA
jgi:hypothetical protein